MEGGWCGGREVCKKETAGATKEDGKSADVWKPRTCNFHMYVLIGLLIYLS